MAKVKELKQIGPLTVMRLLTNLGDARDELVEASLGYKPSERNALENKIARMAVLLARGHDGAVREEFDAAVKRYDEQYGWTNRHE